MSDTETEFRQFLKKHKTDDDVPVEPIATSCLITGEPLTSSAVELTCGHKFNYIAIFNEVVQQKKPNFYSTTFLFEDQLMCPYCRTINNKLLPLIPGVEEVEGVNVYPMPPATCDYIFKRGTRKGALCGLDVFGISGVRCKKHIRR